MSTNLEFRNGIPPKQRDYDVGMSKMVSQDDVVVVIERANLSTAAVATSWTYQVPWHLETAAGEMVPYTGTCATTSAESTSGGGTADATDATPSVVDGVGEVITFAGTAATWSAADTATLTITHTNLRGGTDTDTWVVTFA
jgi:hypothetical protein